MHVALRRRSGALALALALLSACGGPRRRAHPRPAPVAVVADPVTQDAPVSRAELPTEAEIDALVGRYAAALDVRRPEAWDTVLAPTFTLTRPRRRGTETLERAAVVAEIARQRRPIGTEIVSRELEGDVLSLVEIRKVGYATTLEKRRLTLVREPEGLRIGAEALLERPTRDGIAQSLARGVLPIVHVGPRAYVVYGPVMNSEAGSRLRLDHDGARGIFLRPLRTRAEVFAGMEGRRVSLVAGLGACGGTLGPVEVGSFLETPAYQHLGATSLDELFTSEHAYRDDTQSYAVSLVTSDCPDLPAAALIRDFPRFVSYGRERGILDPSPDDAQRLGASAFGAAALRTMRRQQQELGEQPADTFDDGPGALFLSSHLGPSTSYRFLAYFGDVCVPRSSAWAMFGRDGKEISAAPEGYDVLAAFDLDDDGVLEAILQRRWLDGGVIANDVVLARLEPAVRPLVSIHIASSFCDC